MAFPKLNDEQKKLSARAMDVIFLLHADQNRMPLHPQLDSQEAQKQAHTQQ